MIREEIPERLFVAARPGYDFGTNAHVSVDAVEDWISDAKSCGVRSIICLLNEQHLRLYEALPVGLLAAYAEAGFETGHVPVVDHQRPPMSDREWQSVEKIFEALPKPVLVHCSAGVDRTGAAVRHLKSVAFSEPGK